MSWDVVILNLSPGTAVLEDVPESAEITLGALPHVLDLLRQIFGENIDLADPTWGTLEGETFSVEFNIGTQDPCDSIMLHVRGDDAAIYPIKSCVTPRGGVPSTRPRGN